MSELQGKRWSGSLVGLLSSLLVLAQPPPVSPSAHPGRIGLVRFKEVPKLTPDDLNNLVPTGADVYLKKKRVAVTYLAIVLINEVNKFRCGRYIPSMNVAYFDDRNTETLYKPDTVKIMLAEPGTLQWVDGTGIGTKALTDSWFDCEGNLNPTGRVGTPCRGRHLDSLVPGYVHKSGVCRITFDGRWHDTKSFEYIKHTSIGAVTYQAVQNEWMKQNHPPE